MDVQNIITFYGPDDPNFELANFYPSPLFLDGQWWPTVEHYYQAQKTLDPQWKEQVRTAPTPAEAKRLGRATPDYNEARWSAIKEDVMMRAIRTKFTQHKQLRKILLDTGEKLVVEDTPDDPYWGVVKGKGKNRMGHLLMELREELKAADQPEDQSS